MPEVARRQDAQLAPQPPGAAPVVGHRDDGRQVPRVLLEPGEQDRQTGAAPDSHHLGAPAQLPLLIEQIDDARVALGQQRGDHRAVEAHQRDRGQDDAQSEEQPAADLASQELQGEIIRPGREPDSRAVQRAQNVARTEAEEGDADE